MNKRLTLKKEVRMTDIEKAQKRIAEYLEKYKRVFVYTVPRTFDLWDSYRHDLANGYLNKQDIQPNGCPSKIYRAEWKKWRKQLLGM